MIKLETYGSNIPPRSIKNLPKIKHKIIDEQIAGMYLSDHSGICADITI